VLNDAVEPRKQKLYITHKFDGSSDSAHRSRCIDTAERIRLRLHLREEDELSYCGGANELVLRDLHLTHTRVRETLIGDIQCLKGCGYFYIRRWTDVETSVKPLQFTVV
jgi:hypothetical protein